MKKFFIPAILAATLFLSGCEEVTRQIDVYDYRGRLVQTVYYNSVFEPTDDDGDIVVYIDGETLKIDDDTRHRIRVLDEYRPDQIIDHMIGKDED